MSAYGLKLSATKITPLLKARISSYSPMVLFRGLTIVTSPICWPYFLAPFYLSLENEITDIKLTQGRQQTPQRSELVQNTSNPSRLEPRSTADGAIYQGWRLECVQRLPVISIESINKKPYISQHLKSLHAKRHTTHLIYMLCDLHNTLMSLMPLLSPMWGNQHLKKLRNLLKISNKGQIQLCTKSVWLHSPSS